MTYREFVVTAEMFGSVIDNNGSLFDVCHSEENIIDKLVYAFTPDEKVASAIIELREALRTFDDDLLREQKTREAIIPYDKMRDMVQAADFLVVATRELFNAMAAKKDKNEIYELLKKTRETIFKRYPGDSINKLAKFEDAKKYIGKTFGELGYSKAKFVNLIDSIQKNLLGKQKDMDKIKKYSGFFASIRYAPSSDSTDSLILLLTKIVPKIYTFVNRLLLTIYRGK